MDRPRRGEPQRSPGGPSSRANEMAKGSLDTTARRLAREQPEGDRHQAIASQGGVRDARSGGLITGGDPQIGEPALLFEPEEAQEGSFGARSQLGPRPLMSQIN